MVALIEGGLYDRFLFNNDIKIFLCQTMLSHVAKQRCSLVLHRIHEPWGAYFYTNIFDLYFELRSQSQSESVPYIDLILRLRVC